MFLVANQRGLDAFYHPFAMQSSLDTAASDLQNRALLARRPRLPLPRVPVDRLHPAFTFPPLFHRAPADPPSPALALASAFVQPPSIVHLLTVAPLLYDWQHGLYTDGSCKTLPGGNVLGAAYYDGHSGRTCTVQPNGLGATNTILRAELSAISQALKEPPATSTLRLWTDSQCSLYQIRRMLFSPSTLRECKHLHLLQDILSSLTRLATQGVRVFLHKVKAHSGCVGNELADLGATAAAAPDHLHTFTITATNNSLDMLPAWLVVAPLAIDGAPAQEPFSVADLGHGLRSQLPPSLIQGRLPHTKYTKLREDALASSYPTVNSHMWDACSYKVIKQVLLARYGTLWTSAHAHKAHRPYLPGIATAFPTAGGHCPLCGHPDSVGHVLGGCSNPHFKARFIKRHNVALHLLYDTISAGEFGGMFCVMDASSAEALPGDVTASRLPAWLLPGVPDAQRALYRPDLLLIKHLSAEDVARLRSAPIPAATYAYARRIVERGPFTRRQRAGTTTPHSAVPQAPTNQEDAVSSCLPPSASPLSQAPSSMPSPSGTKHLCSHLPAALRQHCVIYIVELSYCSDNYPSDRFHTKQLQHAALVAALRAAGWCVEFRILLLGTAGTVFHPLLDFLDTDMGVPRALAHRCLNRLHLHAVNSCYSIICDRRSLERPSSTTSFQPP